MLEEDKTIDILAERLQSTKLPNGVSFAGEGLKLNTAEDAKEIVDAINSCETLEYLNLEGNTIGVDAAEAISKALEKQPGFKRALWKDMFTGRLKEEIPKALKALCRGVMVANAQLEVLDLSDNASGPIGVDGIAEFIKSPACYTLKQLILNNMGLGVTGAEMLSKALLECCEKSEREGRPLKLKVFIAGRNRLEDDGIKALSQVFKKMGSLEEILIPQNGIRSNGIKALSEALSHNISLRVLNLNDNTLGIPGSKALADGLRKVRDLRSLDIGDCLTKTNGALAIAEMLSTANNIKDVILSSNCITTSGALIVLEALDGKNLSLINLDGNKFGEEGIKAVTKKAQEIGGNKNILTPIEEDEGSEIDDDDEECIGDDDEDVEEDEDYDEEDETDSMYEDDEEPEEVSEEEIEEKIKRDIRNVSVVVEEQTLPSILPKERKETVTAAEFIADPTVENLMGLGRSPGSKIIEEIKDDQDDPAEIFGTPPNELYKIDCKCNYTEKDLCRICTCPSSQEILNYNISNNDLSIAIYNFGNSTIKQLTEMDKDQADLAMKLIDDSLKLGKQGRLTEYIKLIESEDLHKDQNSLSNIETALSNFHI